MGDFIKNIGAWFDKLFHLALTKIVEYRWYLIAAGAGYAIGAGFVGFLWARFGK